ncbi:hypothetical protein [Zhongshania sp. BJYM1]|uniref:hypothetical protein n=1 Tax=Zhongshania aquatica TaxID=2965069 RepID=UPI0022B53952|nr:hypothetical protein [Marortus sp. BJYM1]
MKSVFLFVVTAFLIACAGNETVVYSNGFSFSKYEYVVIEGDDNSAAYGLDVAFGNIISDYHLAVVGSKEYENLPYAQKKRVLGARVSVKGDSDRIVMGIAFQDYITGRTVASMGSSEKGDVFDRDDREEVFQLVMRSVATAINADREQALATNSSVLAAPAPAPVAEMPQNTVNDQEPEYKPYTLTPDFSE